MSLARIHIVKNSIDVQKLRRISAAAFEKAEAKGALALMNWVNNGSPAESATPPIKWGVLKGSSSVFVGNKFIGAYQGKIEAGAEETPDPARAYNGKQDVITIVYDIKYAFRMHEERGKTWKNLGDASTRAKNATDKWLEKHLAADGKLLMKVIAENFKKELAASSGRFEDTL